MVTEKKLCRKCKETVSCSKWSYKDKLCHRCNASLNANKPVKIYLFNSKISLLNHRIDKMQKVFSQQISDLYYRFNELDERIKILEDGKNKT